MSGETDRELAKLQPNEELRLWWSSGGVMLSMTRQLMEGTLHVGAILPQSLLVVAIVDMVGNALRKMREELDAEEAKAKGGQL